MWTKAGSILTLWASPCNCLDCIKKNALKIQAIQFVMLLCSIFVLSGTSSATTFTGFFEDNRPSRLYVDIPLNLATASVVNLTYTDSCIDPNSVEMELYKAGEKLMTRCPWHVCRPEPWGPLPLAAGNWTVRLHCTNESYNPDNPVAYTLEQSVEAGVSQFSEDSEPDATSEETITLTSGRVLSGWIGYQGYSGLLTESNLRGNDGRDDYYFSLTAGTKIKIKLEYDQALNNTLGDRDISIETYRRVGYNLYNYTHFDFSNWWQSSGDTTDEFTIPQDGIYLFRVVGVYGSAVKKYFGGYRMSVIVNGDDPGEGLFLAFQSAEWVKSQNLDQGYPYNLLINFQVENTYGEAKTIRNLVGVNAPGLNIVPDNDRWDTETIDRLFNLLYYMGMSEYGLCGASQDADLSKYYCQHNRIPKDYYIDPQDGPHDCLFYQSEPVLSPYYSIPPHSKTDQTISIPATIEEYQNFDDSIQFVVLAIQDKAVHPDGLGNDGCHVHGLYFRPVKGALPAVNHLLLKAD